MNKKSSSIIFLGIILSFAMIFSIHGVSAQWWNSSWLYSKQVSITENAGNISYFNLTNANLNSHENADFSDVRFVALDNSTLYNFTLENYSPSSWATFRLNDLGVSSFYIYYGNSQASSSSNASATYFGATSLYFLDNVPPIDSVNGYNLSASGSPTVVSGYIGNGVQGGTNVGYYTGNVNDLTQNDTIAIFFKQVTAGNGYAMIGNGRPGIRLAYDNSAGLVVAQINDNGYGAGASLSWTPDSNWHCVVGEFGSSTNSTNLFFDGVNESVSTWDGRSINTNTFDILSSPGDGFTGTAIVDEGAIWAGNGALTTAQIDAYCNQTAPTFTLSSEQNGQKVINITTFENVNVTNNLTVGQNISALNGFFSSLGNLINQITNLFVTNAIITNLNVTGLLYGDGSHLTNIQIINSSYYLTSNPSNYYNNTNLQNLSQLRDNLGSRGYTSLSNFTDNLGNRGYNSLSNFTNNEGFYNSTNPPPANEPNWNGNASNVAYINKANTFNGSINISTGNISLTGNLGGLLTLPRITLPACGSATNGSIGRNSSGLYYCSSTSKWVRIVSG